MTARDHATFRRPSDPDIKIWRYMTLGKFLWMLQHDALYFCRSDLLGDPFEGHYTLPSAKAEDEFVRLQTTDPVLGGISEEQHRVNFRALLSGARLIKPSLFVNCWHMNENESLAMWKLYAAQNDSICVQSRVSKLVSLLPSDVFVGMVRYIDYNTQFIKWGNALEYIVHKRESFGHERELRAVVWQMAAQQPFVSVGNNGLVVPVSVKELIENVFVSPESDMMLVDVLEGLRKFHGFAAPIIRSDVNAGPTY